MNNNKINDKCYRNYHILLIYPYHSKDITTLNTDNIEWKRNSSSLGSYYCATFEKYQVVKTDMIKRMKQLKIPPMMVMLSKQLKY